MKKTLFEKDELQISSFYKAIEMNLGLQFLIGNGSYEFYNPEDIRKIIRVLTDWLFDKKKDERKEKVS